ncbi:hypothetical protein [Pseudogulbenkiania sp. MAI-1]|uniref:hypothetical protein n=1 Tax=Pseudogulbenkiania sp. MAI-1 TaxID=990370 RepID=UPI00045E7B1F|nr:hypothetical protein [Pseudogulbenkiania sp. MAI-1]
MSNYQCEACGKYKAADVSKIGVGDKVNFGVVTKSSSLTIRLSIKEGEVTEVDGDILTIKVKRGGTYKQRRGSVTPEGAPGALTYALFGRCDCGEEAKS